MIERGRFSPRPRNDPKYYGGKYPFIQTGDISRSKGRLREYTQTLNELGKKVSKEFGVDTIVIAIVGATIGEAAILEIPTYAPDSVIGITPRSGESRDSVFIEFVLRFWKPVLRAKAPEAARANINIETLRPLQIIVPPDRHKFSDLMRRLEGLGTAFQQSLTDLEALYGALSQQAFKGELDLSRVPLPASVGQKDQPVAIDLVPPQAGASAIPEWETEPLLSVLKNPPSLEEIVHRWLDIWLMNLHGVPFSIDGFMAYVQMRLEKLQPDSDFVVDQSHYEHVKAWVFEALADGRLKQTYDDAGNRIQLKAV